MNRETCEKIIVQKLIELRDIIKEYDKSDKLDFICTITDEDILAYNHANEENRIDIYKEVK